MMSFAKKLGIMSIHMSNDSNGAHCGVSHKGVLEGGPVVVLKERRGLVMAVGVYLPTLITLMTCLIVLL